MASLTMHPSTRLGRRCAHLNGRVAVGPIARCVAPSRRAAPTAARASLTVRDPTSGAEFAVAQDFWMGDTMRCLGAVTRNKKIVIVNVQIYSVALYVEASKCAKELGIRQRGGFFENDADFCQAVLDGAFHKVLIIRLVRDIDGPMFGDAIGKYLVPRMQLAGEMSTLEKFTGLFESKKLTTGTEVVLLNNVAGELQVLIAPNAADSYAKAEPELTLASMALSRGLFELFLGSEQVVGGAHEAWAAGAKSLLESDNVNREAWKSDV